MSIASPLSRSGSTSPPPNCAICLGTCNNKSFSDSCRHQFCFKCLLEWSKIKAECPLCKQPFQSIIHNVKSNSEYDEHHILHPPQLPERDSPPPMFPIFLPPAAHSRHQFHFRTTFTVDPGGELAIQQMLLTHPFNNYVPGGNSRFGRYRRRDTSATSFRRSVYARNMWVRAPPDVTGRYREISPSFYRENPAARQRLVPWLNRELNALLHENTQQVMHLVDIIMEYLLNHHIYSRAFHSLLEEYLGNKTDHFIHEFSTFMKSPFDMIGYDRHIIYSDQPLSPSINVLSDDYESDGQVAVVEEPNITNNPFHRPVIEVIEINSEDSNDSDVIIREPTPPVVVDLLDSDTDDNVVIPQEENRPPESESTETNVEQQEENRKPILPLKIRLKHKRHKYKYSDSSSSTSDSSSSDDESQRKRKRKKKHRKMSYRDYKIMKTHKKDKHRTRSSGTSDSEDNVPLSELHIKKKSKKTKKSHRERSREDKNMPSCSKYTPPETSSCSSQNNSYCMQDEHTTYYGDPTYSPYVLSKVVKVPSPVKREVRNGEAGAGPSGSGRVRSVIIKKEGNGNTWRSHHRYDYSSDSG